MEYEIKKFILVLKNIYAIEICDYHFRFLFLLEFPAIVLFSSFKSVIKGITIVNRVAVLTALMPSCL